MGEYMFLKKAQGRAENGVLNLYVDSDFTRAMVNKPAVLEPVSAAAAAMLGKPCRVAVVVGQAPAVSAVAPAVPAPEIQTADKLDELLAMSRQFDNIIIKE